MQDENILILVDYQVGVDEYITLMDHHTMMSGGL